MNDTSQFVIDVVDYMPAESEWMIQAPGEEFLDAIREIPHLIDKVYIRLTLKEKYRKNFAALSAGDIYEFIQHARVIFGGRLIFEAYDSFNTGIVSKNFDITETPLIGHVGQDILMVSSEW